MTTLGRAFLLANALLTPWTAFSQALTVPTVEIRSGQSATVMPGDFFSATLAVKFGAPTGGTWRDRLIVPAEWNAMSPADLPFTPTGSEEIRLIAVTVPRTTAQGNYTIYYVIASESDPARELARAELTVTVPSISALKIVPEVTSQRAIAGEKLPVAWRLSNHGNHPVSVELKAHSSLDYAVTISPSQVQLDPGKSAVVTGEVALPANLRREQNHAFLLDARFNEGDQTSNQTALINTLVIPRFTTAADLDEGMQLSLRTKAISRKTGDLQASGAQTELIGHGYLDVERAQRLDFLLRPKPIAGSSSNLLPQEQYTLTYQSKTFDLLLGDNLYSLSPLTQRWLYGRGIGAEYHQPPFSVGSYYANTPWRSIDTSQLGSFLQYDLSPTVRLRGNFLDQHNAASSSLAEPHSKIPSLQLFMESARPNRTTLFEVEGAVSDNNQHPTGDAYRARLHGRWGPDIFYDFEQIHASHNYTGYYSDMESTSGNVTWQIDRSWRTRASFQETETNLAFDPKKNSAPVARTVTASVDRNISPQLTTSLDYNLSDYSYRLPGIQPNFNQETVTVAAMWNVNRISLRTAFEAGRTQVATTPEKTRDFQYMSLFAYVRPKPGRTYSLYVGTGDSRYNPVARRETAVVGAAQWNLGNGFSAGGALSYNQYRTNQSTTNKAADLNLGYDFLRGSSVEIGFRMAELSNHQQDRTTFLSYTVPLRTRVLSQKFRGSLEGILQLQTPEGTKPLAGVVLRLDNLQAATDHKGRFVFPSVKAGRYTLVADAALLGPGIVLDDSRPVVVTIERGKREQVQLNAVRAAHIEGRIALYEPEKETDLLLPESATTPQPEFKLAAGLGQVLVELHGPNNIIKRTVSNEWGRFAFDRLPPGEWTLQIDEKAVPQWHRLERKEFLLNLAPGDSSQVEARVVPVRRPFKMIDEGWISISTKQQPQN